MGSPKTNVFTFYRCLSALAGKDSVVDRATTRSAAALAGKDSVVDRPPGLQRQRPPTFKVLY